MAARGTIVLLHLAGRYGLAGIAWQALHHLIGFRALGWDPWYVEDSGAPPYDGAAESVVTDCAENVARLRATLERFGFGERWAYFDSGAGRWEGMPGGRVRDLFRNADALVNLCRATALRDEHLRCPVRIHVDTDPVQPQVRLADGDEGIRRELEAHTHHFTYGANIGRPDCPVPTGGFRWRATRPPVVPELWSEADAPAGDAFTTIATWRNREKDVVFGGRFLRWSKHVSFLGVLDLPLRTAQPLELALGNVDRATVDLLRRFGWRVASAWEKSADLDVYRGYVAGSRGEFTVAKEIVAATGSGWFSDRSVCYLAAGRPVVTEDTGFGRSVPTGVGLLAFRGADEAAAALEAVRGDWERHSRAAREIAREHFGAERVLGDVLGAAGLG